MFNKKLKLEIVELEERVLQLEKRLENYKKQTNDRLNMEIAQRQLLEELTNNEVANIYKQLRSRKKKNDKNKKISEEKKYEILEEWKIQQGSDKE